MRFVILLILLFYSISSFGNSFLDPADTQNEEHARLACSKLGELCDKYKKECSPSVTSIPNTCIAIRYFELEVAKERCGLSRYIECDERNQEYKVKWMHQLNLPNIGNPKRDIAFRNCEKATMYKVKSIELKNFGNEIHKVFNHIRNPIKDMSPPYYQISDDYYKCFEKNLR